jgi:hypothetical protein
MTDVNEVPVVSLDVPSRKEIEEKEKSFELGDTYRDHWRELERRRMAFEQASDDYESYKKRFKEILEAQKADVVTLDGRTVATHAVSGAFNVAKFKLDNPGMAKNYTFLRESEVFDKERFAKDSPEIYQAYRVRTLRFVA